MKIIATIIMHTAITDIADIFRFFQLHSAICRNEMHTQHESKHGAEGIVDSALHKQSISTEGTLLARVQKEVVQ